MELTSGELHNSVKPILGGGRDYQYHVDRCGIAKCPPSRGGPKDVLGEWKPTVLSPQWFSRADSLAAKTTARFRMASRDLFFPLTPVITVILQVLERGRPPGGKYEYDSKPIEVVW